MAVVASFHCDVIICELARLSVQRGAAEASGSGGSSTCGRGNAVGLTSILDRWQFSSKKGSPYVITERRVPELIPVLGSEPAGDVSHIPGGRLPLLSVGPAVTLATLKRAATNFAAW